MTTAIVSMNAALSHWPALASMCSCLRNCGSATPMMVSFRMTTNVDTMRMPMTSRLRDPIAASSGAVVFTGGGAIWAVSDMAIPEEVVWPNEPGWPKERGWKRGARPRAGAGYSIFPVCRIPPTPNMPHIAGVGR